MPCSHFVEGKKNPWIDGQPCKSKDKKQEKDLAMVQANQQSKPTSQSAVVWYYGWLLCLILQSPTLVKNNQPLSCGLSYEMCKQAHVFNQCISNRYGTVKVLVSSWGAPTPIGTSLSYFLHTNEAPFCGQVN